MAGAPSRLSGLAIFSPPRQARIERGREREERGERGRERKKERERASERERESLGARYNWRQTQVQRTLYSFHHTQNNKILLLRRRITCHVLRRRRSRRKDLCRKSDCTSLCVSLSFRGGILLIPQLDLTSGPYLLLEETRLLLLPALYPLLFLLPLLVWSP